MTTLTNQQVESLADYCEKAELEAYEITKVTDQYPHMDYQDAFDVQWEMRRRKEARGNKIVGMKMGLTSWAKMAQMGVEKPCYGFLADYFSVPDGGDIKIDQLIHPKIEAEVAFVTKAELRGPGVHIGDVLRATDVVMPAVEVIDSRYKDFKFDLISVIADNSSSARFITGGVAKPATELDLKTIGVVMALNGEVVQTGAGAAVLGHPAASVAMLANMLAERGESLPAGSFVMIGAITAAVAVKKGDNFSVSFDGLGTISGRVV